MYTRSAASLRARRSDAVRGKNANDLSAFGLNFRGRASDGRKNERRLLCGRGPRLPARIRLSAETLIERALEAAGGGIGVDDDVHFVIIAPNESLFPARSSLVMDFSAKFRTSSSSSSSAVSLPSLARHPTSSVRSPPPSSRQASSRLPRSTLCRFPRRRNGISSLRRYSCI